MMFRNREQAGERLAGKLGEYRTADAVIISVPYGGAVVGAIVARRLGLPFDVVVVRRLPAPDFPEVALGAIAADGTQYLERTVITDLEVLLEYLEAVKEEEREDARRRERIFRRDLPPLVLSGRVVIVVDDGSAERPTILAALQKIKREQPSKVVLAIPVVPANWLEYFRNKVDELVYIDAPRVFWSAEQFYAFFPEVSDEDVVELLREALRSRRHRAA